MRLLLRLPVPNSPVEHARLKRVGGTFVTFGHAKAVENPCRRLNFVNLPGRAAG